MPFIDIKTSAKLNEAKKKSLYSICGELITIFPGKSEAWLMVNVSDECSMAFKGDDTSECAIVEVKIFGRSTQDAYGMFTKSFTEAFSSLSGIPKDRIYVKYDECSLWGYDGDNF